MNPADIQLRVQQHDALLAANNTQERRLYGDQPALARPALLDSFWAEAAQTDLALRQIGDGGPTVAPPAVDIDVDGTGDGTYSAHIALIHEYTSPLIADENTAYEHGDEFGISDTFDLGELGDPPRGTPAAELRAYQHRFTFTPNRYDVALSMQPIAAKGSPLATYTANVVRVDATRERKLVGTLKSPENQELAQRLFAALGKRGLPMPDLYTQLDADQATAEEKIEAGSLPRTPFEQPRTSVERYKRLESLSSVPLSKRVVLDATGAGGGLVSTEAQADAAVLPDALLVGAVGEPTTGDDDDEEAVVAPARRFATPNDEYRYLVAMADIETALAEVDADGYGVMRSQSVSRLRYGPYRVIDDVREYVLLTPFDSLEAALGVPPTEEALEEMRIQRHSETPLRALERSETTYATQLSLFNPPERAKPEEAVLEEKPVKRERAEELPAEAKTTEVEQVIEQEDGVREETRRKRLRKRNGEEIEEEAPAPPPPRVSRAQGSGQADITEIDVETLFSEGSAHKPFMRHLIQSQAKDLPDEDDLEEMDPELVKQERQEIAQAAKEFGETEIEQDVRPDELLEGFDEDLAVGTPLVVRSPALLRPQAEEGYFGTAVLGVPITATQTSLLREAAILASGVGGWRAAARPILLAALYYKLVPRLFSDEFPREAVEWLVATLQLVRERIRVANSLYKLNVASARQKALRAGRRRRGRATQAPTPAFRELTEADAEKLFDDSGFTTAALPPVLVVDVDSTVGEVADQAKDAPRLRPIDVQTTAIIYATHGLRPRGVLIDGVTMARSTSAHDTALAAVSYPLFDTYGATYETVDAQLKVIARARADVALAEFDRQGVARALNEFYDLEEVDEVEDRQFAAALARSVYPNLLEGERNDVEFCYLPAPTAASAPIEAIRRAVDMYDVLHNEAGALDKKRVLELAKARVSDRRDASDRLLLGHCAAPAYVSAAQQYALAHYHAQGARIEIALHGRTPSTRPFALYRNGAVSVADTLASLSSTSWLGIGRVFADSLRVNNQPEPPSARRFVTFIYFLAPRRAVEWARVALRALRAPGAAVDLEDPIGDALQNFITGVEDLLANPNKTLRSLADDYAAQVAQLDEILRNGAAGTRSVELPTDDSIETLTLNATTELRTNRRVLQIDALALELQNRCTLPFPGLNCDENAAAMNVSDDVRRALAEVWYTLARRYDWFSLGYIDLPFNDARRLDLAPPLSPLYREYQHLFKQLAVVDDERSKQQRFLLLREVSNVHIGRTLWFEEAFIHLQPAVFGGRVREELAALIEFVRHRRPIIGIDYTPVLSETALVGNNDNIGLRPRGPDGVTPLPDATNNRVVTLDPRNAVLLGRARGLANQIDNFDPDEAFDAPAGNHKQITDDTVDLASQLWATLHPEVIFPRRHAQANARPDAGKVGDLLRLTQLQLSVGELEPNINTFLNDQRREGATDIWLEDIVAVKNELTLERARADEVLRRPAVNLALQNAATALRTAVQAAGLTPWTPATDLPTEEQLANIERQSNGALERRRALLDLMYKAARDALANPQPRAVSDDDVSALIASVLRQTRQRFQFIEIPAAPDESAALTEAGKLFRQLANATPSYIRITSLLNAVRTLLLDFSGFDDPTRLRRALSALVNEASLLPDVLTLNAARLALNNPRSTTEELRNAINNLTEVMRATQQAEAARLQTQFEEQTVENNVIYQALVNRMRPVTQALEAYALLAPGAEEEEEQVAAPLPQPGLTRAVLTELQRRYEIEYDRLLLLDFVQTSSSRQTYSLVGTTGSIDAMFVTLLMPAAIERARIKLYIDQSAQYTDGNYRLALRNDVPQALRVGELVRRFCLYGELPLRRRSTDEQNVFAHYDVMLRINRAPDDDRRQALWTLGVAYSPLLTGASSAAAATDEANYVEQCYTLTDTAHHLVPFGADLQLSLLWVRVMRLYLHYQRVNDTRTGEQPAEALRSLRTLYNAAQLDYQNRATTRAIAELPLAATRIQLYLAALFAPAGDRTALPPSVVPRQLRVPAGARNFIPHVDEMRAIDVRLLTSLVTGYDYSLLRVRARHDQFSPEARENENEDAANSDDDERDNTVEDEHPAHESGRDVTQTIDPRYIFRRGVAAKEALVDAYYRAVIEDMYDLTADERGSRVRFEALAPGEEPVQVVYFADIQLRERQDYNRIIAAATFERRVNTDAAPIVRAVVSGAELNTLKETQGSRLVTKKRMLAIYRTHVRNARLDTQLVRPADGTSAIYRRRTAIFATIGTVHTLSTAEQIYEFANGRGYAATQRALFAAAMRNRFYVAFTDQDLQAELRLNPSLVTHYEPLWALVPRAALLGAMQVLAGRGDRAAKQAILFTALETVSLKLDNARHLWHDDTTLRDVAPAPKTAEPIDEEDDDGVEVLPTRPALQTVEAQVAQQATPPTPAQTTPEAAQLSIAAADTTDRGRWRRHVETNIGRLLLGAEADTQRVRTFVSLALSIDPPATNDQKLLTYESQQLGVQLAERVLRVEVLLPVLRALRDTFERLDPGGDSQQFDENSFFASQRDIIESLGAEARAGDSLLKTDGGISLFVLLARTESRRRARWRDAVLRRADITASELDAIRSLADDVEADGEEQAAAAVTTKRKRARKTPAPVARVRTEYAYWATLFYRAIEHVLRRLTGKATKPRKLIESYIARGPSRDAQRRAADAFLRRKPKAVVARDVERYMPVYELLEQLLYFVPRVAGDPTLLRETSQLQPLAPLLLAVVSARSFIMLETVPTTTGGTVTQLASALYPGAAAFTPDEARQLALDTEVHADTVVLVHEFVPRNSATSRHNYAIVNRVARANGEFELGLRELTCATLLERIVSTPLDASDEPMIRYSKNAEAAAGGDIAAGESEEEEE